LKEDSLLMRLIIDNGMRSGIHDVAARASSITLYIDVKAFTREGAATIGAALKPFVEELTSGPKYTADIGQGIHHG
jgi:hypothetical protein